MFNSILNGSLGDTEVVKINFSDGTSTSVPKDLYNKLYKLYDTAYGIAYTYNLPQPKWEHFVEGIGESVITELAYLAFAKNPSKTGSWADVVKERISKYPAPTNYLYAPQPKTQTIVEPEPQPQTIVEPEPQPQTIVEPEPQTQTIVEPEPQTIVEPEPQTQLLQDDDLATVNVAGETFQVLKSDLPIFQRQYAEVAEFAEKNGLVFTPTDQIKVFSGMFDQVMFEYQYHAEQKRKAQQIVDVEPEPPQIAPIPEPTNIQTPGDDGEEGTSLLIPGLILIGGVIGAIILSKKSSKRR
ncbi:MAG: hypothetical protein II480_08850 [Bacteroidales bacterium]|nr:hypothetical protein [Bacteroidales bacterium]